ncbi:MAG: hypothetical protein ACT4P5_08655 [Armatimonadota bacterium]
MKRKVGTTLDAGLYRRAQEAARQQGRSLSDMLEEALERFLSSQMSRASVVSDTKGTFKVSAKMLRAVLEEDPYDAR